MDNRNLFPLGEKEMFMANTGIALTGSSGGAFYNPAALATIETTKLSLSSNTYFASKTQYSSIQNLDDRSFPFTTTGSQSIPSSLVSAWKGEKVTTAFSIFVPHQLKVQDGQLYSTVNYDAVQITRSQSFQILMAGGSVASKLSNTIRLGGTCFYTSYQTSQQFDFSAAPSAASGLKPAFASSFFGTEISGLMCHAGIQHEIDPILSWGATIKTPLITTGKKGTSAQFVQEPTQGKFKSEGPMPVDTQIEIPPEISGGIQFSFSDRLKVYGDLNIQLSAKYRDGNLLGDEFEHKPTSRINVGVLFRASDNYDLMGGFAINPSSLKTPEAESHENYFIGTFGVQSKSENSVLGLGVFVAQSYGEMTSTKLDSQFQETGAYKSDVKTSAVGLLISSGFYF